MYGRTYEEVVKNLTKGVALSQKDSASGRTAGKDAPNTAQRRGDATASGPI